MTLLASCGVPGKPDSNGTNVLGTAVTSESDGSPTAEMAWSADDSEIYFIGQTPPSVDLGAPMRVAAAKTDGSGVRVVDSSKYYYWTLVMPPDRSTLYYTAAQTDASPRLLYNAFSGASLDGLTLDPKFDVVAASPDGRHLAYWSAGAFRAYDLTNASSTALVASPPYATGTEGNHSTITFSPTGDRLFFLGSGAGMISDLGGSVTMRRALAGSGFPAVSWVDDTIRIAWMTSGREVQLENATSGGLVQLWRAPHGAGAYGVWSSDGRNFATWDSECLQWSWDNCPATQDDLYVIGVPSGRATRVARTTHGGGAIAFSKDGERIAYATGGRIYVSDVPRG